MKKFFTFKAIGRAYGCVISYESGGMYRSKKEIPGELLKNNRFDEIWSITSKLSLKYTLIIWFCNLFKIEVEY